MRKIFILRSENLSAFRVRCVQDDDENSKYLFVPRDKSIRKIPRPQCDLYERQY